jgi:hypothetical protein
MQTFYLFTETVSDRKLFKIRTAAHVSMVVGIAKAGNNAFSAQMTKIGPAI